MKFRITILFVLVFCLYPTFAADVSCASEPMGGKLSEIRTRFLSLNRIASWIWVLLGNFAGTLMTNTLAYGEFIGLDVILRKLWQICRNFANYTLGFIFIYSIFKYVLFPSAESPIKLVKNLLIGSVLIQASWFLLMVVFDFSTITLAAVSSFPSQVIASSTTLKESMQTEIAKNNILGKGPNKGVVINAFSDDFLKNNSTDTIWKEEELSEVKTTNTTIVDDLQPKPDNLGKPLLYLGFTAFNTLDYLGNINLDDTDCVTFFTKIFVNILFSSGITILYSLSLLVFVIILVMRLAYLWIIIGTIPIIILLKIVDSSKIVNISKISSFFDIGKILKLIFQPVIFGFWISLMFLFVIVFQKFMIVSSGTFESGDIIFEQNKVTGENLSQNGKTDSLYNSKLQISNIFKMTIYQGIRGIQSFILALVTLVLLWYFIKIAVSTSTSNTMPGLENFANTVVGGMERTIGNMGVVPTPKGTLSLNQLYDNGRSPLMGAVVNDYTSKLQEKDRKRKDEVLNMLGFSTDNDPGLVTDNIKSALKESVKREKGPEEFVKEVGRIRGGVRFSTIKPYIPDWFLTTGNGNETGTYWKTRFGENDWNNIKTQFKGFETMKPEEKEAAFVKAFTGEVIKNFLKIFGYKSGNIKSYNDLQNAIIKGTSSQTS